MNTPKISRPTFPPGYVVLSPAHQWDESGPFVFTPRPCIAWSNFTQDPTKFVFEAE